MSTKLAIEDVRSRLFDIFGDSFTYPHLDTEYRTVNSKVTAICPIHGPMFKKTLTSLLHQKTGCKKCSTLLKLITLGIGEIRARKEMIRFYGFLKNPPTGVTFKELAYYRSKPFHDRLLELYYLYQRYLGPIDYLKPPEEWYKRSEVLK